MVYKYRHKNNFRGIKILIAAFYLYLASAIYINIVTEDWAGFVNVALLLVLGGYLHRNTTFSAVVDTAENLIYTTPNKFAIDINRIKYIEPIRRHDGSIKSVLLRTTDTEFFKLALMENEKFIRDMISFYPHIKQLS